MDFSVAVSKTLVAVSKILVIVSKTLTAVSKILVTISKTLTAVSKMLVAVSRILVCGLQELGNARKLGFGLFFGVGWIINQRHLCSTL